MLISVVFAVLSIVSVSALAVSNAADKAAISVVSIAISTNNGALLLQASDKSSDIAQNATSQSKPQSAEKSESVFSTEWLFIVALFWFVILSNRRGV